MIKNLTWAEKQLENNSAKYTLEYYLQKEKDHKQAMRKNYLQKKYNLTMEEYDKLKIFQKNLCAICGKPSTKNLAVDHCHDTKKVRGLLCTKCNVGIGQFMHDISLLKSAIDYLLRSA